MSPARHRRTPGRRSILTERDSATYGAQTTTQRLRAVTLTAVEDSRPSWVSSKEAARYLGLNLRTLYRLIAEGALPAYKFGRVIRLKLIDLEQFVEAARIVPEMPAGTRPAARSATP